MNIKKILNFFICVVGGLLWFMLRLLWSALLDFINLGGLTNILSLAIIKLTTIGAAILLLLIIGLVLWICFLKIQFEDSTDSLIDQMQNLRLN